MIIYGKFNLADYEDSLIITDDKIASLYAISGDNVYLLPCGENAKRFAEVEKLCKWFLSKNLCKDGKVVAIGGGSVGDTVGFACSVYKRGGVKLVHLPTTLVAQIDSSIGCKTALNVDNVKNAVGTYYQADTLIDVSFLNTLDEKQLLSGLGELFKYRMLSEKIDGLYNGEITDKLIMACADYKQSVCNIDIYDKNERRILNFGHTIGHAVELTYKVPHGWAVANGLYYETLLACKLGLCGEEYFIKWRGEILKRFNLYPVSDEILNLTVNDKKNANGKVGFTLPRDFKMLYLDLAQVKNLLLC